MSRSFADMSPEDRAQCIGMWCQIDDSDLTFIKTGDSLHIIRADGNYAGEQQVRTFRPRSGVNDIIPYKNVIPRFDLPRAWMPDGKPMSGEWDNYRVHDDPHDSFSMQKVRRFISSEEDR